MYQQEQLTSHGSRKDMKNSEYDVYGNGSEGIEDKPVLSYTANMNALGSSLRTPMEGLKVPESTEKQGLRKRGSSDSIGIIEEGQVKSRILEKSTIQKHQTGKFKTSHNHVLPSDGDTSEVLFGGMSGKVSPFQVEGRETATKPRGLFQVSSALSNAAVLPQQPSVEIDHPSATAQNTFRQEKSPHKRAIHQHPLMATGQQTSSDNNLRGNQMEHQNLHMPTAQINRMSYDSTTVQKDKQNKGKNFQIKSMLPSTAYQDTDTRHQKQIKTHIQLLAPVGERGASATSSQKESLSLPRQSKLLKPGRNDSQRSENEYVLSARGTASNNMLQKVGAPIKQRDSMLPKPSGFVHDEYTNVMPHTPGFPMRASTEVKRNKVHSKEEQEVPQMHDSVVKQTRKKGSPTIQKLTAQASQERLERRQGSQKDLVCAIQLQMGSDSARKVKVQHMQPTIRPTKRNINQVYGGTITAQQQPMHLRVKSGQQSIKKEPRQGLSKLLGHPTPPPSQARFHIRRSIDQSPILMNYGMRPLLMDVKFLELFLQCLDIKGLLQFMSLCRDYRWNLPGQVYQRAPRPGQPAGNWCHKKLRDQMKSIIIKGGGLTSTIQRRAFWAYWTNISGHGQPNYADLLREATKRATEQGTAHFEHCMVIGNDVSRTFPQFMLFQKGQSGQEKLKNILYALSMFREDAYHKPFGYTQGVNFVAAVILMNLDNEKSTFWFMTSLLRKHKFAQVFDFTKYGTFRSLCFQLEVLTQANLPDLYDHLRKHKVPTDIYASNWFLTMFACDLPYDVLPGVIDVFLLEGKKGLLRIALSLLALLSPTLLAIKSADEIMEFLSHSTQREALYQDIDQQTLFAGGDNYYLRNTLLRDLERLFRLKEKLMERRRARCRRMRSRSNEGRRGASAGRPTRMNMKRDGSREALTLADLDSGSTNRDNLTFEGLQFFNRLQLVNDRNIKPYWNILLLAPDDVEELMHEQGEELSAQEIDDLHEFYDRNLKLRSLGEILNEAESWLESQTSCPSEIRFQKSPLEQKDSPSNNSLGFSAPSRARVLGYHLQNSGLEGYLQASRRNAQYEAHMRDPARKKAMSLSLSSQQSGAVPTPPQSFSPKPELTELTAGKGQPNKPKVQEAVLSGYAYHARHLDNKNQINATRLQRAFIQEGPRERERSWLAQLRGQDKEPFVIPKANPLASSANKNPQMAKAAITAGRSTRGGPLTIKPEDIKLDTFSARQDPDPDNTPKSKVTQLKRPPVINKDAMTKAKTGPGSSTGLPSFGDNFPKHIQFDLVPKEKRQADTIVRFGVKPSEQNASALTSAVHFLGNSVGHFMANFSTGKNEIGAAQNDVDRHKKSNGSPKVPMQRAVKKKSHLLEISIAEDDLLDSSEPEVDEEHSKRIARTVKQPQDLIKDAYKISQSVVFHSPTGGQYKQMDKATREKYLAADNMKIRSGEPSLERKKPVFGPHTGSMVQTNHTGSRSNLPIAGSSPRAHLTPLVRGTFSEQKRKPGDTQDTRMKTTHPDNRWKIQSKTNITAGLNLESISSDDGIEGSIHRPSALSDMKQISSVYGEANIGGDADEEEFPTSVQHQRPHMMQQYYHTTKNKTLRDKQQASQLPHQSSPVARMPHGAGRKAAVPPEAKQFFKFPPDIDEESAGEEFDIDEANIESLRVSTAGGGHPNLIKNRSQHKHPLPSSSLSHLQPEQMNSTVSASGLTLQSQGSAGPNVDRSEAQDRRANLVANHFVLPQSQTGMMKRTKDIPQLKFLK